LLPAVLLWATCFAIGANPAAATDAPTFELELEAGAVWQSRNDVQIPNDETGTRFSLVDVVGNGPKPAGRLYFTWNINERHGLRALLAPLTISDAGTIADPVDFAGASYVPGTPVDATYQFNSWRLSYRYRFLERERLKLWVGFTAKVRDAKIELEQGSTTSKDTDVGFVPLLHLAADWNFANAWLMRFDFDGLAGGPGRAFDVALKVGRDFGPSWGLFAGYRTIEGGADVDAVYNFAWLHYAMLSGVYRF
jgi:hypothetical protein